MADQRTEQKSDYRAAPGPAVSSAPGPITASPEMAGWVRFGAVVMMVVGVFGVIEGLSTMWWAPTYFVTAAGTVLVLSLASWGWVHLVVGVLVAVVGASLLGEARSWARGAAIAIVSLSAVIHLVFVAAAPVWSILVIVLDMIVLFALVTTWGEPIRDRR
jgi:hypothetical protein